MTGIKEAINIAKSNGYAIYSGRKKDESNRFLVIDYEAYDDVEMGGGDEFIIRGKLKDAIVEAINTESRVKWGSQ